MRSAPGSEGLAANCAEFVFAHYLASDCKHDLLQLPDDFNAALSRWLDQQVSRPFSGVLLLEWLVQAEPLTLASCMLMMCSQLSSLHGHACTWAGLAAACKLQAESPEQYPEHQPDTCLSYSGATCRAHACMNGICALSLPHSTFIHVQADTLAVTQLRARHALRCGQYTQAGRQYLRGAHSGQEVLETAQQSLALAKLCAVAAAPDSLSGTLPPQVCRVISCIPFWVLHLRGEDISPVVYCWIEWYSYTLSMHKADEGVVEQQSCSCCVLTMIITVTFAITHKPLAAITCVLTHSSA